MTTHGSAWDFAEAAVFRDHSSLTVKRIVRDFNAYCHDRGVVFQVGNYEQKFDTKRAIKLVKEYVAHNKSDRLANRMLINMIGKKENRDKPVSISVGQMMSLTSWRSRS